MGRVSDTTKELLSVGTGPNASNHCGQDGEETIIRALKIPAACRCGHRKADEKKVGEEKDREVDEKEYDEYEQGNRNQV